MLLCIAISNSKIVSGSYMSGLRIIHVIAEHSFQAVVMTMKTSRSICRVNVITNISIATEELFRTSTVVFAPDPCGFSNFHANDSCKP